MYNQWNSLNFIKFTKNFLISYGRSSDPCCVLGTLTRTPPSQFQLLFFWRKTLFVSKSQARLQSILDNFQKVKTLKLTFVKVEKINILKGPEDFLITTKIQLFRVFLKKWRRKTYILKGFTFFEKIVKWKRRVLLTHKVDFQKI